MSGQLAAFIQHASATSIDGNRPLRPSAAWRRAAINRRSESMVFPHGDEAYSSVRSAQATNLIAVNMDQDYDAICAEKIQRGDTIEFPANHPDVKWHVEEGRASKPPCNQPGVLWYVEELVGDVLVSPLGDLYKFTVKAVGAGAEVDVQVRGHVPVRRYQRNHR
jgi:hypothetical protein